MEQNWFFAQNGQPVGPVTLDHLRGLAAAGRLTAADLVYHEGLPNWVPAGSVPELFGRPSAAIRATPAPRAAAAAPPARPAAEPAPGPAGTAGAAGLPWLQPLLALPKPVLFGLCGAVGGLVAALLVGELLWALLRPAAVEAGGPSVQLAVAPVAHVYRGGETRVGIKIARRGFDGPVSVAVENAPEGVRAPRPITLAAGRDEGEITVQAAPAAAAGTRRLVVAARGPENLKVGSATGNVELKVIALPPGLRLAVSPQVVLPQGGKNRFTVRLARTNFKGPVRVQFDGGPPGLLPPVEVRDDQDEAQVEVTAPPDTPPGKQRVAVRATAVAGGSAVAAAGAFELEVQARPAPKADVVFVLDLTGSMQFAINGVKDGIRNFVGQLAQEHVDVRIGLVAFRDIEADKEEPYVLLVDGKPFTKDYAAFAEKVRPLVAGGGGDEPESSLQGLALAAKQPFREGAARILVLITDAPPKRHANIPPKTVDESVRDLQEKGITQVHLVVRQRDLRRPPGVVPDPVVAGYWGPFQKTFKGSFFDIQRVAGNPRAFAGILPKLGEEISRITVASLPKLPDAAPPPALPASGSAPELPPASAVPTLGAVQSTQAFAARDRFRLVLAIAFWTAVIAGGISLLILAGQDYYLRHSWPGLGALKALGGGLLAGLVGGAVGQLFFQATSGSAAWEAVSRVVGWGLLGAVIGGAMALVVPNLKWYRGLAGGSAGGVLGALAFLLVSLVVGALLGRWIGAAVLGFCIGLMVALAEMAFRRWWLEVAFGREVRTVTLGAAVVSVGGDERLASVFVQGAPPVALRYWLEGDRVLCEDATTGQAGEVGPGDRRRLGGVTVSVCSPGSAQASGYTLQLAQGKALDLGVGMPLTAEDLPGLEAQGQDGVVALVSRRPGNAQVLVLRNRSRQTWTARRGDGARQAVEPGRGIDLDADLLIDFGGLRGRLRRSAETAAAPR
jgi:Ca-activated chloride channel family protein